MDIVNVQPAIAETSLVLGKLQEYFQGMKDYMTDPNNPLPSFEEVVSAHIAFADTLGVAVNTKDLSANKSSGYVVDAAHTLAALDRESSIRFKSKSAYYTNAESEMEMESSVCSSLASEYKVGMTGGIQS